MHNKILYSGLVIFLIVLAIWVIINQPAKKENMDTCSKSYPGYKAVISAAHYDLHRVKKKSDCRNICDRDPKCRSWAFNHNGQGNNCQCNYVKIDSTELRTDKNWDLEILRC